MTWRLGDRTRNGDIYYNSDGGTLEIGDWRSSVDGEFWDVIINRDSRYVSDQKENIIHTAKSLAAARSWAKKWMKSHPNKPK